MKKLIIILTLLISTAYAQVTIKGRILRIENCTFTDTGCIRLSYIQPTAAFFNLSDTKLLISGTITNMYHLFDKDTIGFAKDRTISYEAKYGKQIYIVAIKEISTTELVIAIFPFNGELKYKQYIMRIGKSKLNNK